MVASSLRAVFAPGVVRQATSFQQSSFWPCWWRQSVVDSTTWYGISLSRLPVAVPEFVAQLECILKL
eukprot:5057592-Amphidinium_carterae.1